jgi:hypothetical protein
MEKTVRMGEYEITLKATAGALVRYKQQFGSDYSSDLLKLNSLKDNPEKYLEKTVETGYRLVWAMAKTADNTLSSPDVWRDEFDSFDLPLLLGEADRLFMRSVGEDSGESDGEAVTAEALVATALCCGLNTEDIDNLSLSMLMGIIDEYCRIKSGDEQERTATQADFDAFKR